MAVIIYILHGVFRRGCAESRGRPGSGAGEPLSGSPLLENEKSA